MPLLWALLWSLQPRLVLSVSDPHLCTFSSHSVSPSLDSLHCYNDYASHVSCRWRTLRNSSAQLWLDVIDGRMQCVPDHPVDAELSSCRLDTKNFAIGNKHIAFFLDNKTLDVCSSQPKSLVLSQLLRPRPPVQLTTWTADDGGQWLQWSSPYPPSSSLNRVLSYQLSYRMLHQDEWTTHNVSDTRVKLDSRRLLPGHRFTARVRTRADVGQWSIWSHPVTWTSGRDVDQVPSVDCELAGDGEVMCSWDLSRERAHYISFTLMCRTNATAASKPCCMKPRTRPDSSGTMLRFSCSLNVSEPEHVLLDLKPTLQTKTFDPSKNIRPPPPHQVNVSEKGDDVWLVEWSEPRTSTFRLSYQVCYYRTQEQGSLVLLNISEGSTSLTIQGRSLVPSQVHQVRVRSLVVSTGRGFKYECVPSEWTDPVEWTSNRAPSVLLYVFTAIIVASVFLTLYCTIPACQRKVVLWVDSVPSPGKSKILSEIRSSSSKTLIHTEDMSICKVQELDNMSTCSSEALLWSNRDPERTRTSVDQDEGCWSCENLPSPAEKVSGSDTSSMSFSGPYIFCQSAETSSGSAEETRTQDRDGGDVPLNLVLFGEGYVCLPSLTTTRSTQDLTCHGQDHSTRLDPKPDPQLEPERDPEPDRDQPPDYYSGPFPSWPPGGSIQASGYCQLPAAFMRAAP
ncbi:cytokine receptor common subunit beta [Mugil cephalus]|uniref:cytokine receptor common subunit beta n=1 Tax=Mugil cephalus TaxID=48193 RepID=UPI001FB6259F|nr:cytokine receptor common subunit beta [Mugil cephalus]